MHALRAAHRIKHDLGRRDNPVFVVPRKVRAAGDGNRGDRITPDCPLASNDVFACRPRALDLSQTWSRTVCDIDASNPWVPALSLPKATLNPGLSLGVVGRD